MPTARRSEAFAFIKHLVRITTKRNSFYVTLGLSRLLHQYSMVAMPTASGSRLRSRSRCAKRVRIVHAQGDAVWPLTGPWKEYKGDAEIIAKRLVKDLESK